MISENIEYKALELSEFYYNNRVKWEQFYQSERDLFERIGFSSQMFVLDAGCACGGLGKALEEKFGLIDGYYGVDINEQSIISGKKAFDNLKIFHGDILDLNRIDGLPLAFDRVVSLSCIDWNVEFSKMLKNMFSLVKEDGCFVSSFRLTTEKSLINSSNSYQYVNFEGKHEGEIAPYVILNPQDIFKNIDLKKVKKVTATGYWGKPSASAVVPYENIVFAVFAFHIGKREQNEIEIDIQLPDEVRRLILNEISK